MSKQTLSLLSVLTVISVFLAACGVSTPAPSQVPVATEGATAAPVAIEEPLSGTIAVSGAFALYPMMTVWADEFHKLHPDVQFDVQGGGAGKGMTDTIAGAVDIGMISRSIKPEEEAQNIFWVAVTKDAVFPLVSSENPVAAELIAKGISKDIFNKIFITGEIKTWGEVVGKPEITDEIHVYTRSDSAGAADIWAQFAGAKVQADILTTAIAVNGEPALVDTVIKDPLGIGFSNLNSVFDVSSGKLVAGGLLPPIDANGNGLVDGADEYYQSKTDAVAAVSSGKYPSPPSRFENLATLGKPDGLKLAFIKWILTDGQKYLDAAGYVPLTPDQQAESLKKIE
jgi:phosphate transport system substrate-binding protein